jgi:NAD(P)-dependent dehydrogenase (short-subunit alcohol dehydrogenase family)
VTDFGWATTATEVASSADLSGRVVVLTGGSSGIGVPTARALLQTGASLVVGVRDLDRAPELGGDACVLPLDLRDPRSVTSFADQVTGPVDVLVANAGVSKTPDAHLPNGLDVRFATNHLGHFLLARRLHDQLALAHRRTGLGARIVVLSSAAHKGMPVRLDDLQWQAREHVDGMAYAESKSANILFAQEATRRWSEDGIFANAVLPGSSLTGLQRFHGEQLKRQIGFIRADGSLDPMMKTHDQGAATSVWAATATELEGRGGLVLEDCAVALVAGPDTHPWSGYDPTVADPETARRLWDHSEELLRSLG